MRNIAVLKRRLRRKFLKGGALTRINRNINSAKELPSIRGKQGLRRKLAQLRERFVSYVGGPNPYNPQARIKRLENMRKRVVRKRAIAAGAGIGGSMLYSRRQRNKRRR